MADRASGKKLVVKHVSLDGRDDADILTAIKEVEALNTLRHPNIVRYVGAWVMPGVDLDWPVRPWGEGTEAMRLPVSKALEAWADAQKNVDISAPSLNILTEYVDGGSLDKLICRQKGTPINEDLVGIWLAQLILAVQHMHDRRLLHRDIKASGFAHTFMPMRTRLHRTPVNERALSLASSRRISSSPSLDSSSSATWAAARCSGSPKRNVRTITVRATHQRSINQGTRNSLTGPCLTFMTIFARSRVKL